MNKFLGSASAVLFTVAVSQGVLAASSYERAHAVLNDAWDLEAQAIRMGYSAKSRLRLQEQAREEYIKALGYFVTATQENANDYKAYSMSGLVLRRLGRFDEAMDAYQRALALNPSDYQTIEYLGEAQVDVARIDEAKKTYLSLMNRNTALAADLLAYMKMWTAREKNPGASLSATQVEALDRWIDERADVTEKQLSLSPSRQAPWH